MLKKLGFWLNNLWEAKRDIKLKIVYLSSTFLLMSMCLVIWRPLKSAVFPKMVGVQFIPNAKLYSLFFVIPLILLYSVLVDWLRRHHLLYCFTLFYGIGGLIFAYFLSHPVYGIANTQINPHRWIGWAFYFFMESFDAFFSTTFWAFADSINNPKDARNYYGIIVAGSKIGGIVSAGALYTILRLSNVESQTLILPRALGLGSFLLFAAGFTIYMLIKKVSQDYMHGYEMVYQLERQKQRASRTWFDKLTSPIEGLTLIIKNSYVLGIFSLVIFYEVMVVIFDYWVALSADASSKGVGDMTAFYASYYFIFNFIGLGISILGTTPLLRITGIRVSLFVFPLLCISMLLVSFFFPSASVFFWVLIGLRAFNYALNHPTREILYIPTTKDIKYKAKTWTDAFGSRIAKSFGSLINVSLKGATPAFALFSSLGLSLSLTSLWVVIVYFLGKTLHVALTQQKVIGEEEESTQASEPQPQQNQS